jgi:kynurenine formamidase
MSGDQSPWGPDDEVGRLNLMTAESQVAVLRRLDGRQTFDLGVEYFFGMPTWTAARDPAYEIWMTHTPTGTIVDDLSQAGAVANERYSYAGSAFSMYSHTGTHICSLNHIGRDGRFSNGWRQETHLGSRAWTVGGVFPPIIARGILLDIASDKGVECLEPSYAITEADLRESIARTGLAVEQGDVVLIRTGLMSRWPSPEDFLREPPGLGMGGARYLCEEVGAMCIGVDAGGEALPAEEEDSFLPVHAYLLATAGVPIVENLWLEELARSDLREFGFLAFPLKLRGSTGCPVRPVVVSLRNA